MKQAVTPLLTSGTLNRSDAFQLPMGHHPNVEGHRFLASIVAHYLQHVLERELHRRLHAPWQTLQPLYIPRWQTLKPHYPTFVSESQLRKLVESGKATARDWAMGRKGYTASRAGATLDFPFRCKAAGCGLSLSVTKSYQPLGLLDVYVDQTIVASNVSACHYAWAKARSPRLTIQDYRQVVRPRARGETSGGLTAGEHVLKVVARGETDPEVVKLNLPSNYTAHEVHVRGFLVEHERLDFRRRRK